MKRRYRFLLVLATFLAGAAVWWTLTPSEPVYQGKPLSRWIAEIKAGDPNNPSRFGLSPDQREAIQSMGLEALPDLLEAVRPLKYEPWWKATYRRCYSGLPSVMSRHLPVPVQQDIQREMAFRLQVVQDARHLRPQSELLLIKTLKHARPEVRAAAASALGWQTNSSSIVFSALTNCLRDRDVEMRRCVVDAISCFGPAASNAVPAIAENIFPGQPPAKSSISINEQAWAAMALGKIGSGAVAAVPVLQQGAGQSTNAFFRVESAVALWRIRHQPADALPALLQEWGAFDPHMKWKILGCFGEMGSGAATAVPLILSFLDSPPDPADPNDSYNRTLALDALRKIAPEVATKREREATPPKP